MRLKLQERILLPVIIVIIAGMGGSIYVSNSYSKKAITELITDRLKDNSFKKVEDLLGWIKNNQSLMKTWTGNWVLQSAARSGASAKVLAVKKLEQLNNDNKHFSNLAVINKNGDVIAASKGGMSSPAEFSDFDFFKKAISGKSLISNTIKSPFSNKDVFYLASPLIYNEVIEGILICEIELKAFEQEFFNKKESKIIKFTFIIDSKENLIASSKNYDKRIDIKKRINIDILKKNKSGMTHIISDKADYPCAYSFYKDKGWFVISASDPEVVYSSVHKLIKVNISIAFFVILTLCIIIFILVRQIIIRPVSKTVDFATRISGGDLMARLEIKNNDEIGDMVKALNSMGDQLINIFQIDKLRDLITSLLTEADYLKSVSKEMNTSSKTGSKKSESVNKSSEILSENLKILDENMSLGITRFENITESSENISGAVKEVAQYALSTKEITQEAVDLVYDSTGKITLLEEAAKGISEITETIKNISSQTNLLALNATIEAARAGEYGKGFAVVAKEIKELATKTSDETDRISQQILSIQDMTENTIDSFKKIGSVIDNIDLNVLNIADSSENQSKSAKEIAKSIILISDGVKGIYEKLAISSKRASDISSDISDVSYVTHEMEKTGYRLKDCSIKLNSISNEVGTLVDQFKI